MVTRDHIRQAAKLAHRSDTGSLANPALPNHGGEPVIRNLRDLASESRWSDRRDSVQASPRRPLIPERDKGCGELSCRLNT